MTPSTRARIEAINRLNAATSRDAVPERAVPCDEGREISSPLAAPDAMGGGGIGSAVASMAMPRPRSWFARMAMLMSLGALLLVAAPGCVSAALHDSSAAIAADAATLQADLDVYVAASVANPAYNEAERALWARLGSALQAHARALHAHAAAMEEASR